jgi:Flp pilus assembly protein TadB
MPLSEHEQRILAELEESLSRQDPRFADKVASESIYRHASRRCKWAAFVFVLALVGLIALYSISVILGVVMVAIMFASALYFERNLRNMGRAGWHDVTRSLHEEEHSGASGGIENAVHEARTWFKDRFRRSED